MENRRKVIIALGAGALATPFASFAQKKPARVYRIGILALGNSTDSSIVPHLQEAFTQGLRELGYVEGQNVIIERRSAEDKIERLPDLAAELVRIKVDVIVATTDPTIAAVKRATQTIPIVMITASDPVGTGFVASLARPGGNVTGLSTMAPELGGKRLELLREVVPGLARVAVIWNPEIRGDMFTYNNTTAAARTLGLQLQSVELSRAEDLERALSAVTNQRAQGLVVLPSPVTNPSRIQIATFAQRNRLPTIYGPSWFVEAGGLMSYGTNTAERWRRAATYVDKILKGAKPADLPVEQPTKFELVVNLKTAKALGVTIPQSVLVRADLVIE
jgi:putative ABC transport system substrate-binding protein